MWGGSGEGREEGKDDASCFAGVGGRKEGRVERSMESASLDECLDG